MTRSRLRSSWFILMVVTLSIGALLRLYFSFIPRGASVVPFILASVEGGTLESPNGRTYEVWFNDAGAAHSGNYWTWITAHHPILGKYVVTEGYLTQTYAVEKRDIPVVWNDDKPMIQFASDRYED